MWAWHKTMGLYSYLYTYVITVVTDKGDGRVCTSGIDAHSVNGFS